MVLFFIPYLIPQFFLKNAINIVEKQILLQSIIFFQKWVDGIAILL